MLNCRCSAEHLRRHGFYLFHLIRQGSSSVVGCRVYYIDSSAQADIKIRKRNGKFKLALDLSSLSGSGFEYFMVVGIRFDLTFSQIYISGCTRNAAKLTHADKKTVFFTVKTHRCLAPFRYPRSCSYLI